MAHVHSCPPPVRFAPIKLHWLLRSLVLWLTGNIEGHSLHLEKEGTVLAACRAVGVNTFVRARRAMATWCVPQKSNYSGRCTTMFLDPDHVCSAREWPTSMCAPPGALRRNQNTVDVSRSCRLDYCCGGRSGLAWPSISKRVCLHHALGDC